MEIIAFIYLMQRDKALNATTHAPQRNLEYADLHFVLNFRSFDLTHLQTSEELLFNP